MKIGVFHYFSEFSRFSKFSKIFGKNTQVLRDDTGRESIKNNVPFIDILLKDKEISNIFNRNDLLKIVDPANYLGAGPAMARRLLNNR